MEGRGHAAWIAIFNDYFTDFTTSIYETISKGAQAPTGCTFEQSADWNEINFAQSLQ